MKKNWLILGLVGVVGFFAYRTFRATGGKSVNPFATTGTAGLPQQLSNFAKQATNNATSAAGQAANNFLNRFTGALANLGKPASGGGRGASGGGGTPLKVNFSLGGKSLGSSPASSNPVTDTGAGGYSGDPWADGYLSGAGYDSGGSYNYTDAQNQDWADGYISSLPDYPDYVNTDFGSTQETFYDAGASGTGSGGGGGLQDWWDFGGSDFMDSYSFGD